MIFSTLDDYVKEKIMRIVKSTLKKDNFKAFYKREMSEKIWKNSLFKSKSKPKKLTYTPGNQWQKQELRLFQILVVNNLKLKTILNIHWSFWFLGLIDHPHGPRGCLWPGPCSLNWNSNHNLFFRDWVYQQQNQVHAHMYMYGSVALLSHNTLKWSAILRLSFFAWCWWSRESVLWGSSAFSEFRTSLSKVLTLWHCVKVK